MSWPLYPPPGAFTSSRRPVLAPTPIHVPMDYTAVESDSEFELASQPISYAQFKLTGGYLTWMDTPLAQVHGVEISTLRVSGGYNLLFSPCVCYAPGNVLSLLDYPIVPLRDYPIVPVGARVEALGRVIYKSAALTLDGCLVSPVRLHMNAIVLPIPTTRLSF